MNPKTGPVCPYIPVINSALTDGQTQLMTGHKGSTWQAVKGGISEKIRSHKKKNSQIIGQGGTVGAKNNV